MTRLAAILVGFAVACCVPALAAQNEKKDGKGKNDRAGKEEPVLTPELAAFKKEIESWPADKLRQAIATEKKSLEEWARKNNFDPPGDEYDRDKGKGAKSRRLERNKVKISKRKQAELMAQFVPWKAKIDLMERVLHEHDSPKKDARPKKDK